MSEVILVRPGHTDFDEQRRIQGLLDLPLSARGEQHVRNLVGQLRPHAIDVILTDPGEPARTTAEILGESLDVPVKEVSDLRNLDLGLWQGLHLDEIRRKYPKLLKQWHEHPETICPPQGEPVCDAMSRIHQALRKPLRKYKRIAIVAADPLATLIAGEIRHAKPEFTGPMCSHAGQCVELLAETAPMPVGSLMTGPVNGQSCNGKYGHGWHGNGQVVPGEQDVIHYSHGSGPSPAPHATTSENNGHEFRD